MGRGRDISVQPEWTEEEVEKSVPSPSMSTSGRGNHDSRAGSYVGVVSKAVQSFEAQALVTLDGNARASSGNRTGSCLPLFYVAGKLCLKPVLKLHLINSQTCVAVLAQGSCADAWQVVVDFFFLPAYPGQPDGAEFSAQFSQGGRENANTSSLTIAST